METITINGLKAVRRRCPLCEEPSTTGERSRYSDAHWAMTTCGQCGFIYLECSPLYGELAESHAWEKSVVSHRSHKKQTYPLLQRLSKRTRWRLHLFKRKRVRDILKDYLSTGNVLDIGCGDGTRLKMIPEGLTPFGIEISETLAHHASEHCESRGGKCVVGSAIDGLRQFPEGFASGIVMRSYLEHETEPMSVLQQASRVLAADGIVIIKVPNFQSMNRVVLGSRWCGFRFPDHLNYFTPQTLVRMCKQAGFSVRRFRLSDRLPTSDDMWAVMGKD